MAAFSPIASRPIAAPVMGTQGTAFINEAASATEAQAGLVDFVGAIAESATATEIILEFEIMAEAGSATDTPSCGLIRVGAIVEARGAREAVLSASLALVASAIAEAATATDTVSLPIWTDNTDDDQTWSTNTNADSTWTANSHAESTWTEN